MDKMDIYNNLPIFAQNIACYFKGKNIQKVRYSSTFWKYLEEYNNRNDWSYEQLRNHQDMKLKRMVRHCYETVPYYRNLFDSLGINYESIRTIEDLKLLPILSKDTVNKNFKDFISTSIPKTKMVLGHTSGTTGSGFKFYTTNEAISEQWAVWWRFRQNLGIEFNTWTALFGSNLVVPIDQNKPPYWRINKPCKQIYFSAFHENEDNLYHYFNEINRRKLRWIHGFPSLLTLLASFILKNNLKFDYKIEYVTIGAENLLDYQRNIIEEAFGTKVYQHYGLAEGVSNFSQNKDGEMFVDEDFAITEFLPNDNDTYNIIGTNLTNFAMPLLRYDTKDTARFINDKKTGKRKVLSIDGRTEDYITLPNGVRVGKLDHAFKDTVNIVEAQISQKADYSIIVYAVKNKEDVTDDENQAVHLLRKSLGYDISIDFKYVTKIPRTAGGKLRFVISEIK